MCFSIKMEIKTRSHQFQKTATMNSQTTIGPSHFYQFYLKFAKGLYTINSLHICNQMTPYQRLKAVTRNGIPVKTSVIDTTDTILNAIDKKKLTAVVLLDLSKAFDSVNHETLILKLQDVRTSSRTLQWFRSYLSNRKQEVWIHSTLTSDLTQVELYTALGHYVICAVYKYTFIHSFNAVWAFAYEQRCTSREYTGPATI